MNVPRGCRLGIVLVDTRVYSTQSTSRVLPYLLPPVPPTVELQLLPLLSDLSQAYLLQ